MERRRQRERACAPRLPTSHRSRQVSKRGWSADGLTDRQTDRLADCDQCYCCYGYLKLTEVLSDDVGFTLKLGGFVRLLGDLLEYGPEFFSAQTLVSVAAARVPLQLLQLFGRVAAPGTVVYGQTVSVRLFPAGERRNLLQYDFNAPHKQHRVQGDTQKEF